MKCKSHLEMFYRAFEFSEPSPQAFPNRRLYDTWANLRLEYSAAKGLMVICSFLKGRKLMVFSEFCEVVQTNRFSCSSQVQYLKGLLGRLELPVNIPMIIWRRFIAAQLTIQSSLHFKESHRNICLSYKKICLRTKRVGCGSSSYRRQMNGFASAAQLTIKQKCRLSPFYRTVNLIW